MSSTHPFLRVLIIFPLFFPPSTCFSILPEEHGRGYHSSAHHLKGRVSSPAWNFAEGGRSHGRSHTAGGDSGIFATRFSRGIASSAKANRYLKLVTVDDHGAKGDERTDDTEVPIDTNSKDHTHVIANTSPYIYIYIYIITMPYFQAFKKAWKAACSSERGVFVVPNSGTYRLRQITFSGPCKQGFKVKV